MAGKRKDYKNRKDGYDRLHRLGASRVAQIDDMLIKGMSAYDVAKVIQKDWQQCTDITEGSVRRMLDRYKSQRLAPKVTAFIEQKAENDISAYEARRVHMTLDVMQELTDMYILQRERIRRLVSNEDWLWAEAKRHSENGEIPKGERRVVLKFLGTGCGEEIATAARILKDLGHLHLETGLIRKSRTMIEGSAPEPEQHLLPEGVTDDVRQLVEKALTVITGAKSTENDDAN